MTACPDRELLLHAWLDGELDAANSLALEQHLDACPGCRARVETLQTLRERLAAAELRQPAPAALRRRIEAALDAEARPGRRGGPWRAGAWRAGVWAAGGAIAAGLLAAPLLLAPPALELALVDDHVRSLQPGHLIDVATSDRHVVRPWFNGRADFAPPVPELADRGFPLVGGRLDYAAGRTVAAVVYRRRAHVINLFVLPAAGRGWASPLARLKAPAGYCVEHWQAGGLDFWAISDVEGAELAQFRQAFQARQETPR